MNKVERLLTGIWMNEDFLDYVSQSVGSPIRQLSQLSLINGYCGLVSLYVKKHIPEVKIVSAPDHKFLFYEGKYYDGMDIHGQTDPNKLYFYSVFCDDQPRKQIDVDLIKRIHHNQDKEILFITHYVYPEGVPS